MVKGYALDANGMRNVARFTRGVEQLRPSMEQGGNRARSGERQRFVVVSDMPAEAIAAGTDVFPVTCQAIMLRDARPTFPALEFGCFPPGGSLCRDYPPCYRCPITMRSNRGDVLTFTWTRGDYPFSSANPLEYTADDGTQLLLFYRGDGTDCCCLMQFSFSGLVYQGQHPGCGSSEFGPTFVGCDDPDSFPGPCRWTATTDCTDTTEPNGTVPQGVIDAADDGDDYSGQRFTINLAFFGGIPFRGELIEAKNLGNQWYALNARNLAVMGLRVAGADPYRLAIEACVGDTDVPFAYLAPPSPDSLVSGVNLGGEAAYGNKIGQLHLVKWNPQRRRYELAASKCPIGVFGTSPQWNPYGQTCNPCGFPCETMPFVFDSGGSCPDLDGTYTMTPTDGSAFGCTFSETAAYGIYWLTETIQAGSCSAQFAAYCVKDSTKPEGARWVVEYCCSDSTHLVDSDADLQFVCGVVRYGYSLSGDFGCCCKIPCITIGDYPNLTLDLVSDCAAFDCEIPLAAVAPGIWDTGGAGCVPQAILTCDDGDWLLQPNVSCQGLPTLAGSITSLTPLVITFPSMSWSDIDNCCGGGAGATYNMSATVTL